MPNVNVSVRTQRRGAELFSGHFQESQGHFPRRGSAEPNSLWGPGRSRCLWLVQVPRARSASRGLVTNGLRFLPHVSLPANHLDNHRPYAASGRPLAGVKPTPCPVAERPCQGSPWERSRRVRTLPEGAGGNSGPRVPRGGAPRSRGEAGRRGGAGPSARGADGACDHARGAGRAVPRGGGGGESNGGRGRLRG